MVHEFLQRNDGTELVPQGFLLSDGASRSQVLTVDVVGCNVGIAEEFEVWHGYQREAKQISLLVLICLEQ